MEKSFQTVREGWHEPAAFTCKWSEGGSLRPQTQRISRTTFHLSAIVSGHFRNNAGKFSPGYRRRICQMPDALFAINQKVERGVYQIRHIGRRDTHVSGGCNQSSVRQIIQHMPNEVGAGPWAKEGARANDQRFGKNFQYLSLRICFAAAVNV